MNFKSTFICLSLFILTFSLSSFDNYISDGSSPIRAQLAPVFCKDNTGNIYAAGALCLKGGSNPCFDNDCPKPPNQD